MKISAMIASISLICLAACSKPAEQPQPVPAAEAPKPPPEPQPAESKPIGELAEIGGEVLVKAEDAEQYDAAEQGMKLFGGDKLKTGETGKATVSLFDGSVLKLSASSLITIEDVEPSAGKKPSIFLWLGKVWSKVEKAAAGDERYTVTTLSAVAGVRGTMFNTGVSEDGTTRITVRDGEVEVDSVDAEQPGPVSVRKSEETSVGLEEKPQKPKPYNMKKAGWKSWFKERQLALGKNGPAVMKKLAKLMEVKTRKLQGSIDAAEKLSADRDSMLSAAKTAKAAGDTVKFEELNKKVGEIETRLKKDKRAAKALAHQIKAHRLLANKMKKSAKDKKSPLFKQRGKILREFEAGIKPQKAGLKEMEMKVKKVLGPGGPKPRRVLLPPGFPVKSQKPAMPGIPFIRKEKGPAGEKEREKEPPALPHVPQPFQPEKPGVKPDESRQEKPEPPKEPEKAHPGPAKEEIKEKAKQIVEEKKEEKSAVREKEPGKKKNIKDKIKKARAKGRKK